MDTIRNTGPGLITRILYEYLCCDVYDNNNNGDNDNGDNNDSNDKNKGTYDNDNSDNGFDFNRINDNDNKNDNKNKDILILPYKSFNPVPNTVITDLSDRNQIQFMKNKYLNECNDDKSNNDNTSTINNDNDNNENNKKSSNIDKINDNNNAIHSYAIHWWQRSWQL
jgi:hypothetical protein